MTRRQPPNRTKVPIVSLVLGFLLVAACAPSGQPDSPSGAPAGIAELATGLGCQVYADHSVTDFRQASCQNADAHYVLLTFTAESGQQAWLGAAKPYGGTFLVGKRWVVVANQLPGLDSLQDQLGGEIQVGGHAH